MSKSVDVSTVKDAAMELYLTPNDDGYPMYSDIQVVTEVKRQFKQGARRLTTVLLKQWAREPRGDLPTWEQLRLISSGTQPVITTKDKIEGYTWEDTILSKIRYLSNIELMSLHGAKQWAQAFLANPVNRPNTVDEALAVHLATSKRIAEITKTDEI